MIWSMNNNVSGRLHDIHMDVDVIKMHNLQAVSSCTSKYSGYDGNWYIYNDDSYMY